MLVLFIKKLYSEKVFSIILTEIEKFGEEFSKEFTRRITKDLPLKLKRMQKLQIEKNSTFCDPVKNINEKYLEASIYLMTSRFEGFGMVLIESMASGLPCIAYDCPCGPRTIIENDSNGFLIENGNENQFIQALEKIIIDENLRFQMGKKAKISVDKYKIDAVMQKWDSLLKAEKN